MNVKVPMRYNTHRSDGESWDSAPAEANTPGVPIYGIVQFRWIILK